MVYRYANFSVMTLDLYIFVKKLTDPEMLSDARANIHKNKLIYKVFGGLGGSR